MLSLLIILLQLVFSGVTATPSAVKTLPGFAGDLPFSLETGYIGVGESDEVQLFYYFVESERNPKDDPLMLWLTGGPGCSALSGLIYEIGPFTFDYANSSGKIPALKLNPYSWTKVANIIFLDQPIGTGYSYGTSSNAYNNNDTQSAAQTYEFMKKWFIEHPKFADNQFYIGADSYCGIIVPIIVQSIYEGNEAREESPINIKGYLLGNPTTNHHLDNNSRFKFAHQKGLLSNQLYESVKQNCQGEYINVDPNNVLCVNDIQAVNESVKQNCQGEYINVDPNNVLCVNDIQAVNECLDKIRRAHILEPYCYSQNSGLLSSSSQLPTPWCREDNYVPSYTWANNGEVKKALHVREGTISEWVRCNESMHYHEGDTQSASHSYVYNVQSSYYYHQDLTNKHCRALIYSGDHDLVVPHEGTEEWIESLNLPVEKKWKPWFVDGQIAGYQMKYVKENYYLTYATVKGGGHTAPEYKPKECLAMVDRWFAENISGHASSS